MGLACALARGKVAFRSYAATKEVYTTRKFDLGVYYDTFVAVNVRFPLIRLRS